MATVSFEIAGMHFEYDEDNPQKNIKKHHIDFRSAARVFLIMTELNILMSDIVKMRTGLIQ